MGIIRLYMTYFQLAENLDGQLARMCEDLKEIISHLNTSAQAQDSRTGERWWNVVVDCNTLS